MDFEVRVPIQLLLAEMPRWHKSVWISVRSFQGAGDSCRASYRAIGERAVSESGPMDKAQVYRAAQALIAAGWMFKRGRNLVCHVPENPVGASVKNVDDRSTNVDEGSTLEISRTLTGDQRALTGDQQNVDEASTRTENQNQTENQKREERTRKVSGGSSSRFKKPTLTAVQSYFSERGVSAPDREGEKFFDYYESNGWRVGRNSMKNWKAAARQWQSRMAEFSKPKNGHSHGKSSRTNDRRTAAERSNELGFDEIESNLHEARALLARSRGS